MTTELARRLFTVDEYYRMAEAGILREDDRVELINGEIVEMPPIGRDHMSVVDKLNFLLTARIPSQRGIVRVQGSLILGDRTVPEPDIAVLAWRSDFYRGRDAGPVDILLLVEVADSSLDRDLNVKVPLYARAGISEYFIVNVLSGTIEVYREPSSEGYQWHRTARMGDSISLFLIPEVTLAVAEVLG